MDAGELLKAAGRYRLSQAIYAAAALGVADQLLEGDRSPTELAAAIGADATMLRRVLRALASEGVFEENADDTFALGAVGRLLARGGGAREMVLGWSVFPPTYEAFARLADSVRSGRPAFEMVHGTDFHGYLTAHPDDARAYDEANAETSDAFDAAVAAYDFSRFTVVVDVGGGTGGLLGAILQTSPGLRGVVFDAPSVVARINDEQLAPDVRPRLGRVGGDFFRDLLPRGDAYVLSTVLRLFDDDRAIRLLRNIRAVIPDTGKVLVLDFVHPPGPLVAPYGLADLQALVAYGGKDRSASEFSDILRAAGLRLARVIGTTGVHSWVEATT